MAIDKRGRSTGQSVRELADELENDLILNYRKQFVAKTDQLIDEVNWNVWRREQVAKLPAFVHENRRIINRHIRLIAKEAVRDMDKSYNFGVRVVERQISEALKKGIAYSELNKMPTFRNNERVAYKLRELQESFNQSAKVAMHNLESQYLNTIQMARFQPSKTLFGAIDIFNRKLAESGITGTVTSNNRRINIANHIEMSVVETSQEVLFIGEAAKSEDAGLFFVYITQHRSSCPQCTPWQGKVLIDDVYMPGKPDGKHELLSTAIKAGLFHYNCRCNRVTYIPGVDVIPSSERNALRGMSKREQHDLYKTEQEQRYNERQIRQWKRREALAMTPQESERARLKVREYQGRNRVLVKQTDGLYRNYWREKPGFEVPRDVRWANLKHDKHMFDNPTIN